MLRRLPPTGRRAAVEPAGTARRARDHRLRLCDVPFRRAAFRRALPLSRAGRTRRLPVARETWIGCSRSVSAACSFSWRTSSPARSLTRISGSIAGPFPPAGFGARRDPSRRHGRALVATAAMLFAELRRRAGRCRACFTFWASRPWSRSRSVRGVSFSSSCSGRRSTGSSRRASLPRPRRGAGAHARSCPPDAPRVEHAALGHPRFARAVVGRAHAALRNRSEPAGWNYYGDRIFGASRKVCARPLGFPLCSPRVCDRVHPLSARPQCLSNVGPSGPRGGARSARASRQRMNARPQSVLPKEIYDQTRRLIAVHGKFSVDLGHRIA